MDFKEILCCLFILNLLQCSLTETVENSTSLDEESEWTPKQKLLNFYNKGLKHISKEYCEKVKNISEYILKDEKINLAQTPQIQEFKKNITEFLEKYDSYARYGLYNDLVEVFTDIALDYVDEVEEMQAKNVTEDAKYIENLLIKLDYIPVDDSYEDKFSEFIAKKFTKRYKKFKSRLTEEELKKEEDFIRFHDELIACKDYSCHIETFEKSVNRSQDDLIEYIEDSIRDIFIYYGDNAVNISNNLLKDKELIQTNSTLIEEFIKNITEFVAEFSSNDDPDELPYIAEVYTNLTAYYFEIPKDKLNTDTKIIVSVLKRLGAENLETEYKAKFMDLVFNKISEILLELKSSMDKEELEKLKPMLDWYEELKSRKISILVALEKFYEL